MKMFAVVCSAIYALSMSADVLAQTRGPRYNPSGSGHNPVHVSTTVIHFGGPRDYYTHVGHHYIYRRWVQYPVNYWYIDGYPY